jgi:hypothetical protein
VLAEVVPPAELAMLLDEEPAALEALLAPPDALAPPLPVAPPLLADELPPELCDEPALEPCVPEERSEDPEQATTEESSRPRPRETMDLMVSILK